MQGVTLGWAADACRGELLGAPRNRPLAGLCIDSRRCRPGDLFVALRGDRTDGHAFMAAAAAAGAAAALCARAPEGLPAIRVRDPRRALGQVAAAYRRRFKTLRVAAVTGSTGKTTTKEMLAAVLAGRYCTWQSAGNLNNDLGLPLSLAGLEARHAAAVFELGMNAPGEIRALARMAAPQVGVITNVGDAHHGRFKDRKAIARAKAELLAELPGTGTAVVNADDPLLGRLAAGRRLTFGAAASADVRVLGAGVRYSGTTVRLEHAGERRDLRLAVLGQYHAWNAAAAVAAGLAMGLTFSRACRALEAYRPQARMRMQLIRLGPHRILNDAYNSNPQSASAALAVQAELPCPGRKWLVAGSMLELGPLARRAHARLGRQAAASGIDGLITVGREAREVARAAGRAGLRRIASFAAAAGVGGYLARRLSQAGDLILVKGSRAVGLEAVVEELRTQWKRREG